MTWIQDDWMIHEDRDGLMGVPLGYGPTLELDVSEQRADGKADCDVISPDGQYVCRLWKDHDGPHVPLPLEAKDRDLHVLGLAW